MSLTKVIEVLVLLCVSLTGKCLGKVHFSINNLKALLGCIDLSTIDIIPRKHWINPHMAEFFESAFSVGWVIPSLTYPFTPLTFSFPNSFKYTVKPQIEQNVSHMTHFYFPYPFHRVEAAWIQVLMLCDLSFSSPAVTFQPPPEEEWSSMTALKKLCVIFLMVPSYLLEVGSVLVAVYRWQHC